MKFRIKKRFALVAWVAVGQAICLMVATIVFSMQMRSAIRTTVHGQVLADNVLVARQMTTLFHHMDVGDLRQNLDSWSRIQETIRDIKLPNEGYVCLTDSDDGSLLCHPALGNRPFHLPLLAKASVEVLVKDGLVAPKPVMDKPVMGQAVMDKPVMDKPVMDKPVMDKPAAKKPAMIRSNEALSDMKKTTPVAMDKSSMAKGNSRAKMVKVAELFGGSVEMYEGELQIIAAGLIPELNATIRVHQKASGIEAKISQVMRPVIPLAFGVSLVLILTTSSLVMFIVQRYENRLAAINENLEDLVDQRTVELRKTRDAVAFGLAKLAESRDTDTGEHLDRIRLYVSILAGHLGRSDASFDDKYIETLSVASSLHDIGKVGIPDAILLKPGRFNPDERAAMEKHSAIGGECLQAIGQRLGECDFLQLAREIAFCHHEKWDGSGYPFQIAGEAIPLSARVVALADVYDALRSRRPYKEPMTHERARSIILEGSGSHFDPMLVDAFIECEESFIEVSERYNACSAAHQLENDSADLALT